MPMSMFIAMGSVVGFPWCRRGNQFASWKAKAGSVGRNFDEMLFACLQVADILSLHTKNCKK